MHGVSAHPGILNSDANATVGSGCVGAGCTLDAERVALGSEGGFLDEFAQGRMSDHDFTEFMGRAFKRAPGAQWPRRR